MKYFASLLLTVSFLGMAVFGLALFQMSPNHEGGCIAAIDGATCPTNIVAYSTHHIAALQVLTRTTVTPISSTLLLLTVLLLAVVSALLLYKNQRYPKLESLPERLRGLDLDYSRSKQKIASWLSLFEFSPAL